jgi:hypothetical protein
VVVGQLTHPARATGVYLRDSFRTGSCRFFIIPSLQLTSFKWFDLETSYAKHLFPTMPFAPTLCSLFFRGSWDGQLSELSNLTSFTFWASREPEPISAESFRTFILNNQSLEKLVLDGVEFGSHPDGPPVVLSNIKSLLVCDSEQTLSLHFCVPALQRLSSLFVVAPVEGADRFTFRATGEGIVLAVEEDFANILGAWQDLTGHVKPTIRYVRLENPHGRELYDEGERQAVIALLKDVHTLEMGRGYFAEFYPGFREDLERLSQELRTVRFEMPEEREPHSWPGASDEEWTRLLFQKFLYDIKELVINRYLEGRPFSAVERMVVSESELVNQEQDDVWTWFCDVSIVLHRHFGYS